MLFFAIIIGLITGVLFYSSTVSSYKKAGAGQTYEFEASTDVNLTRRLDTRTGTRSSVDHGFYSTNVSASGRKEAYHMPQSIKHSIEQAKEISSNRPQTNVLRPQVGNRPPIGIRPGGASPKKPGGPHRPGRK